MSFSYKIKEIVFAKCQNYPYWPAKVIKIFENTTQYKVLFYGQKSEATIDISCLLPFNQQTYRKMLGQSSVRTNQSLRNSLNIANKSYQRRKKGLNSEDQDEFQQLQHKKPQYPIQHKPKPKFIPVKNVPDSPYTQFNILLDALSNQASSLNKGQRIFTIQQQNRLKYLLSSNNDLLLASLIENRVIQKMIIVLKQLDQWGLQQFSQLNYLHALVRSSFQNYKNQILSQSFIAIPLKQSKRQFIIQKILKNKILV